jgi:hypothetical protein
MNLLASVSSSLHLGVPTVEPMGVVDYRDLQ